jgi:hypothetical protein
MRATKHRSAPGCIRRNPKSIEALLSEQGFNIVGSRLQPGRNPGSGIACFARFRLTWLGHGDIQSVADEQQHTALRATAASLLSETRARFELAPDVTLDLSLQSWCVNRSATASLPSRHDAIHIASVNSIGAVSLARKGSTIPR